MNAKPVAEESWTAPFEAALKNMTSTLTVLVGDHSEYTSAAKNTLNSFSEGLKSELSTLSKTV